MLAITAAPARLPVHDAATPPASSAPDADPAGFASLLRQRTQGAQPSAAPSAPAEKAAPTPTPPAAQAGTPPRTGAEQPVAADAATARTPADAADALGEPAAEATAEVSALDLGRAVRKGGVPGGVLATMGPDSKRADAAPEDAGTPAPERTAEPEKNAAAEAQTAAGSASAIDPSVLHWLAGQQRANLGTSTAGSAGRTASGDATASVGTESGGVQGGAREPRAGTAKDAARDAPGAAATHLATASTQPEGAALPKALATAQALKDSTPATSTAAGTAAALQGIGGAAPLPTRHDATAAVAVVIATPVTAPEFPQALGVQMSVLARDGVQQAELQLHPVDMGPVSVQIVMDGTQARVDFGADVAATRQAIEAGLPELASALRDAGFTLAGGSVSQHSQSRGGGNGPDDGSHGSRRGRTSGTAAVADEVPRAARRTVRLGGLDLSA